MTKSELIERIAQAQSHLVERDVALAVNMMLDHMATCLSGGGRIEIRGFAFSVLSRFAGVVAQPLRVGDGDEEQVQRLRFDGAGLNAAFTHQAVVEPAELRGGASPAVGAEQSFLDHRGLLGRCRGPIDEAGAR